MHAVTYPDFAAAGTARGFPARLRAALPTAQVVAVLNGPAVSPAPARCIDWLHVLRTAAGFNTACLAGLTHAADLGADRIVRVDTAEHDLTLLPAMLTALGSADVVVADLTYPPALMPRGTVERVCHDVLLPALTSSASGGAVTLGGAHGLIAWRSGTLRAALPTVRTALRQLGTAAPAWAADTALVVAAARAGARVQVMHVPAGTPRHRPAAKCREQVAATAALLTALP